MSQPHLTDFGLSCFSQSQSNFDTFSFDSELILVSCAMFVCQTVQLLLELFQTRTFQFQCKPPLNFLRTTLCSLRRCFTWSSNPAIHFSR